MYWMTGEHGTHVCYDASDMKRHLSLGWKLLNEGPSPIYPQEVKPAEPAPEVTPQVAAEVAEKVAEVPADADILDGPVAQILPQLEGMTRAQLESLKARELGGKTRKGLMLALANAIEDAKA